jgi:hypothetical protein
MPATDPVFEMLEMRSLEDRAGFAAALRQLAAFLNERVDQLDGDVLLTVQQTAKLAGRTDEAVRVWFSSTVSANSIASRIAISSGGRG